MKTVLAGHRFRQIKMRGPGYGRCECGAGSELLPSHAARRRWHGAHKDEALRLLAGREVRNP